MIIMDHFELLLNIFSNYWVYSMYIQLFQV